METLLIISHEVKNFDTWKTAFEAGEPMRAEAGVKIKGVYRSQDNENMVTVISQAPSAEVAKALINNPALKAGMAEAGVISAPEFKILACVN
jgi:quinol monooxygenase YgiN